MYGSPSTSSEMPEDDTKQPVAKDDSHYSMDHPRWGIAAIFNVNTFDDRVSGRRGSEVDVQNVTRSFAKLGFEVEVFSDRTLAELQCILEELSSRDHCDADCFVLVFMSHGGEGHLRARDRRFDVNILWDPFTADNCPSLENKPKVFIIQACQGDSRLGAVRVGLQFSEAGQSGQAADVTKIVPTYLMPVCADFLIALSTIPGYKSYRDRQGSRYIQSLCCHLDSHGFEEDLLTLLTHVGRKVALDRTYISIRGTCRAQLPLIISVLIRVFKFTKKDQAKNCVKRRNSYSDDRDCDENSDERSPLPLETAIHQSIAGLEEEGDTRTSAPSSKRTKK